MKTVCNDPDLTLTLRLGQRKKVKPLTLLNGLRQAAEHYQFRHIEILTTGDDAKDSQQGQALSRSMPAVTVCITALNESIGDYLVVSVWKEGARLS